jgi:diguanylate cyclase
MTDPGDDSSIGAPSRPEVLAREIAEARLLLDSLHADIHDAEARLQGNVSYRLLEANEQLVLAMLRAQSETDSAVAALESASHSAEHDVLTGLPNRALLQDRYTQASASARRHGARMALLFIDLDDFKQINDSLGHPVGDALLIDTARRLLASTRDVDTVARFGGDEFVVLVSEIALPSDAGLVAAKLLAAIAEPLVVGDQVLRVTASIGIGIHPDDADTAERLLALADEAMYVAKAQGGGCSHFVARPVPPALRPEPGGRTRPRQSLAESAHLNQLLREANEQLVVAALGAAELKETAEQALARHQACLALLGHEIRTPLSPLLYAAALLDRGPHPPQALARLKQTIERQVVQIARLVDDMLALALSGQTQLKITPRPADLVALAREAVEVCQPALEARGQRLMFRSDRPVEDARLDAARIVQVLVNLIDNASKYTPPGGYVSVSVTSTADEVVVSVRDDGMGLASSDTQALFEPFLRAPEALASGSSGVGIGLTVVRELVTAHHGTVEVSSAGVGQGAEFTVRLPR